MAENGQELTFDPRKNLRFKGPLSRLSLVPHHPLVRGFDINLEHAFEALRPAHGSIVLGGVLISSGVRLPRPAGVP